jgi:hypothetical protein
LREFNETSRKWEVVDNRMNQRRVYTQGQVSVDDFFSRGSAGGWDEVVIQGSSGTVKSGWLKNSFILNERLSRWREVLSYSTRPRNAVLGKWEPGLNLNWGCAEDTGFCHGRLHLTEYVLRSESDNYTTAGNQWDTHPCACIVPGRWIGCADRECDKSDWHRGC